MSPAAVTFYDIVLWLHVSAVVIGFGGTFAYGMLLAAARSSPRSLPGVLEGMRRNDRVVVTAGAVVVLATGIYLAADSWEFSDFFISWGILAVLVLLGITHGMLVPAERRAQEAAERDLEAAGGGDPELGDEFNRANGRLGAAGTVAWLIIILTVYVMVAKPFG